MHATLETPTPANGHVNGQTNGSKNGNGNGKAQLSLALLPNKIVDMATDWCSSSRMERMEIGRQAQKLFAEEAQMLCDAIKAKGDKPSLGMLKRAAEAPRPATPSPLDTILPPAAVAAAAQPKPRRTKIDWDATEWHFVINGVARMRMEQPGESLSALTEKIIGHMPPDRRRSVTGVVQGLSEKLAEFYQDHFLKLDSENQKLKADLEAFLKAPSPEEVLCTLTREEIVERYASEVLASFTCDDLIAKFSVDTVISCLPTPALTTAALQRTLETFTSQSAALNDNLQMLGRLLSELPAEKLIQQQKALAATGTKLPHVALVGFKNDQGAFVADALKGKARIEVIDKNRSRFESSAEIIVMWARFVSHGIQNSIKANMKPTARLIIHNCHDEQAGGLKAAINEIRRALG